MAVRIDREGYQFLDPIGIGATGGGVPVFDDGIRPAPWEPGPWAGRDSMAVSDALELMGAPAEILAETRPPVPYVLFPEQFGYDDTPLTIEEVLDTDRWAPRQRSYVSPDIRYTGSSRNSMGMEGQ